MNTFQRLCIQRPPWVVGSYLAVVAAVVAALLGVDLLQGDADASNAAASVATPAADDVGTGARTVAVTPLVQSPEDAALVGASIAAYGP